MREEHPGRNCQRASAISRRRWIVRRKNEESLWSGHARNQGLTRLVNAGRMHGLEGLSQGIGLDLKPYAVGHVSSAPGSGMSGSRADGGAGLDVFYNLTPALRLNVSVNTDFAETEVDERRVNLTRFPLFFEEKRDFFLEGSSYFDFGRVPDETVVPFFSRQIGRDARGRAQRIDLGTKLTGRAGAFDVGVLQVRTARHGHTGVCLCLLHQGIDRGEDALGNDPRVVTQEHAPQRCHLIVAGPACAQFSAQLGTCPLDQATFQGTVDILVALSREVSATGNVLVQLREGSEHAFELCVVQQFGLVQHAGVRLGPGDVVAGQPPVKVRGLAQCGQGVCRAAGEPAAPQCTFVCC